jgi:hypothetical protein
MNILKEKIIKKLITDRYKNMEPLEVALLFEKLNPDDKASATAAILLNDNTVAKVKIMEYMVGQLSPIIDTYIQMGSVPTNIVEELLQ